MGWRQTAPENMSFGLHDNTCELGVEVTRRVYNKLVRTVPTLRAEHKRENKIITDILAVNCTKRAYSRQTQIDVKRWKKKLTNAEHYQVILLESVTNVPPNSTPIHKHTMCMYVCVYMNVSTCVANIIYIYMYVLFLCKIILICAY